MQTRARERWVGSPCTWTSLTWSRWAGSRKLSLPDATQLKEEGRPVEALGTCLSLKGGNYWRRFGFQWFFKYSLGSQEHPRGSTGDISYFVLIPRHHLPFALLTEFSEADMTCDRTFTLKTMKKIRNEQNVRILNKDKIDIINFSFCFRLQNGFFKIVF